jgi:hypothetical protein
VYVCEVAPEMAVEPLYHCRPYVALGAEEETNTTLFVVELHSTVDPVCEPIVVLLGVNPVVTAIELLTAPAQPDVLWILLTVYAPATVVVYVANVAPLIAAPSLYHCNPYVPEGWDEDVSVIGVPEQESVPIELTVEAVVDAIPVITTNPLLT